MNHKNLIKIIHKMEQKYSILGERDIYIFIKKSEHQIYITKLLYEKCNRTQRMETT